MRAFRYRQGSRVGQGREMKFMGQLPLFSCSKDDLSWDEALLGGIGRLICAWGMLEQCLEHKIGELRQAAGDMRTVGARTKPNMSRLLTELRAMISMRDRRNAAALSEISEVERDIQRIDRFRGLIISGFQMPEPGGFACRDPKNNVMHISLDQLDGEVSHLQRIGRRLLAL